MADSPFWEYLCGQSKKFVLLIFFAILGLLLNTISLRFTGPAGTVVAAMNYVGFIALLGGSSYVLWRCDSR